MIFSRVLRGGKTRSFLKKRAKSRIRGKAYTFGDIAVLVRRAAKKLFGVI